VANRLAHSTSPYLQQHAENPVDWWEWSPEAFEEARRRDVPIFLSIGYSACHWCHVMAHECFENDAMAEYLNENFVSIKVDREERPDVDSVYMDATVALTGQGGWPMSVFIDHDARPFYAGTYIPPRPAHGLPSFPQVMTGISEAWRTGRGDIESAAERIGGALRERRLLQSDDELPDAALLQRAVEQLSREFDSVNAGFGGAPKFPPSMLLEFLLREAAGTGSAEAYRMASATLEAMARGGIYDQLGGGFARYSVDAGWVVPHFEKMLYDNALLLRVYAHWYRLTADPLADRVVRETVEFLLRDLRTAEGAFAAALDADSEGVEGKFYAWTPAELSEVLGEEDGLWAAQLLTVTDAGTFEHGSSTLQMLTDPRDLGRWRRIRLALFEARESRVHPGRDDKVVASWNGLVIAALADAGILFSEPSWIDAAVEAADLLISVHLGAAGDDRLARTSRDGAPGSSAGVLDDYGSVAEGLLALYQATGNDEWLMFAGLLLDVAIQHFSDDEGGFFDTADDAEQLIIRPRDPSDNAEPSGWFAVANACVTYSALTGLSEYRVIAEEAVRIVTMLATRAPRVAGWGLVAASAMVAGPIEIAVTGSPNDEGFADLLATARFVPLPGTVVAWGDPDVPLMRDRPLIDGRAAAYICRGFVCTAPVTEASSMRAQLEGLSR
jgi:uncharacterized protein YyaL (SSP411 family)